MSAPSVLQSDSYMRTISAVREALEKRITNATLRLSVTPHTHRGRPNMDNLPDERIAVWLDWDRVSEDLDGSTQQATCLQSRWVISIISRDESSDAFGSESSLCEQVWSDIMTTLTEQLGDTSLDGAIEWFPDPEAQHARSTTDRVEAIEMYIDASHAPEMVRQFSAA